MEPHGESSSLPRRSLLKWAIHGMGALCGVVLGLPAIAYLLDGRNRPAPSSDFRTVGRLSDLSIGVPQQVVIEDVRRDAWTLHPNDIVGRVWLIRRDQDQVDAYTTICPHLGCSVNFREAANPKDGLFVCPCHGGTFDITGQRVERPGFTNPAPRGMDKLTLQRDPANPDLLQVKYQNFIQGQNAPISKS